MRKRPHDLCSGNDSTSTALLPKRVDTNDILVDEKVMTLGTPMLDDKRKVILMLLMGLHPRTGIRSQFTYFDQSIIKKIKEHFMAIGVPHILMANAKTILSDIYNDQPIAKINVSCPFEGVCLMKRQIGFLSITNQTGEVKVLGNQYAPIAVVNNTAFIIMHENVIITKRGIDGTLENIETDQNRVVLVHQNANRSCSIRYWPITGKIDIIKKGYNCVIAKQKGGIVTVYKVDRDGIPDNVGIPMEGIQNFTSFISIGSSCLCAFVITNGAMVLDRDILVTDISHIKVVYVVDGTPTTMVERTFSVPGRIAVDPLHMGFIVTMKGDIAAIPGPHTRLRKKEGETIPMDDVNCEQLGWKQSGVIPTLKNKFKPIFSDTMAMYTQNSTSFILFQRSMDGSITKMVHDVRQYTTGCILFKEGMDISCINNTETILYIVGLNKNKGIIAVVCIVEKSSVILYVNMHTGMVISTKKCKGINITINSTADVL
jgi:hypothetical protein